MFFNDNIPNLGSLRKFYISIIPQATCTSQWQQNAICKYTYKKYADSTNSQHSLNSDGALSHYSKY